jgi:hypothetical protein
VRCEEESEESRRRRNGTRNLELALKTIEMIFGYRIAFAELYREDEGKQQGLGTKEPTTGIN